jgi:hypothetical protein
MDTEQNNVLYVCNNARHVSLITRIETEHYFVQRNTTVGGTTMKSQAAELNVSEQNTRKAKTKTRSPFKVT